MNQDSNPLGISLRTEKILELQEELLDARKELNNKQASWDKERNQLLGRQEIMNMEVIELRQRLTNLSQINEALMQALSNNEVTEETMNGIKTMAQSIGMQNSEEPEKKARGGQSGDTQRLKEAISEKNREIKALNSKIGSLQEEIKEEKKGMDRLRKEMENKLNSKEDQILSYYKENSQLANREHQLEGRVEELEGLLRRQDKKSGGGVKKHQGNQQAMFRGNQQAMFNQGNQQAIFNQGNQQAIFNQGNQQARFSQGNQQAMFNPFSGIKQYNERNSSYLMLKPTSDQNSNNTSYFNDLDVEEEYQNQGDDGSEEEEKLLCEVCERVYTVVAFQAHLSQCRSQMRPLKVQQRNLENKLQACRREEQKENGRYYRKKQEVQPMLDYSQSNADKVNEIQRIMKEYNRQQDAFRPNKNDTSYAKFSIKNFNYD